MELQISPDGIITFIFLHKFVYHADKFFLNKRKREDFGIGINNKYAQIFVAIVIMLIKNVFV